MAPTIELTIEFCKSSLIIYGQRDTLPLRHRPQVLAGQVLFHWRQRMMEIFSLSVDWNFLYLLGHGVHIHWRNHLEYWVVLLMILRRKQKKNVKPKATQWQSISSIVVLSNFPVRTNQRSFSLCVSIAPRHVIPLSIFWSLDTVNRIFSWAKSPSAIVRFLWPGVCQQIIKCQLLFHE